MDISSRIRQQLVGAWTLGSYVETDVITGGHGQPLGPSPLGFIIYSPDGYMSAQLQARDRKMFIGNDMYRGAADEYIAAGSTYLAYSGRFTVDEATQVVSHFADVSFFPNWFGQVIKRVAKFEGDNLILQTEKPQQFNGTMKTAELLWRRAYSEPKDFSIG